MGVLRSLSPMRSKGVLSPMHCDPSRRSKGVLSPMNDARRVYSRDPSRRSGNQRVCLSPRRSLTAIRRSKGVLSPMNGDRYTVIKGCGDPINGNQRVRRSHQRVRRSHPWQSKGAAIPSKRRSCLSMHCDPNQSKGVSRDRRACLPTMAISLSHGDAS